MSVVIKETLILDKGLVKLIIKDYKTHLVYI